MDYRLTIRWALVVPFWVLSGLLTPLFAQEKEKLDSLNLVINSSGPDSAKISALIELSRIYTGIDDDKAFLLAKTSIQKSTEAGSSKWLGFALNRMGTLYDVKGKPDSATACFIKALTLFEEIRNLSGLAAVYQNIGVMHYYQKDFDKAFENYQKALTLRSKTGEVNYVAQLYNNMGGVMRRKKEYDSAIVYYQRALEIKRGLKDKQSLASSLMNISVAYQYKRDFNSAIDYMNRAIALCKETGNDYDLSSCHIGLGEIYLKMRKTKEAKEQTALALALAQKLKSNELLLNIYEEMALCDTLAGDHKSAFLNYVDAMYYKDQVYSEEKTKAITRLQTFYETEKKDKEIRLLNIDNEAKDREKKFLVIILSLSLVLLAIALWAFFNKQKHNRVLTLQKKEIENKTGQLKAQAAQIARLSSQMNPHFLFNALNSLQKFVLNKDETSTLSYIGDLSKLMRATLNNSTKEYISIAEEIAYLELYLSFEQKLLGAEFSFKIENAGLDLLLPPMLIQPLAENAVKHGLAPKQGKKYLLIFFEKENEFLKITVRDNGVGRSRGADKPGHHSVALGVVQERIHAEFTKQGFSDTVPSHIHIHDLTDPTGTEVTLHLPLLDEF